jgi:nucleoside-diphosphate-sugar epimerase
VKQFIYLSSAVVWGISFDAKLRSEKDYNNWHSVNNYFPYFSTKREAHEKLLKLKLKLKLSLLCPSIVHGSLESEKDSRPHLKKIREGKLSLAPGGGNSIVPLERVSQTIVNIVHKEPAQNPHVQLLVGENLSYQKYFQKYADLSLKKPTKIRKLNSSWGYLALFLIYLLKIFHLKSSILESLVQSSFYLYFESEHNLLPAMSTDEALKASLE